MALDVEGVIGGCESLRGSHALEPLHLPLPSSDWPMRILRSIVAPSATLVAFCDWYPAAGGSPNSPVLGPTPAARSFGLSRRDGTQFRPHRPVEHAAV